MTLCLKFGPKYHTSAPAAFVWEGGGEGGGGGGGGGTTRGVARG